MKKSSAGQGLYGLWSRWLSDMPRKSKMLFVFSAIAGVATGAGQGYLLAFITSALAKGHENADGAALSFFALCLFIFVSGVLSVTLSSWITQDNHYNLRLRTSRKALSTPLEHLYVCGPQRIMTVLTDDVDAVVQAQDAIPVLLVEGAKLAGAFVYLGCVSFELLELVAVFLVCGVASWMTLQSRAKRWLRSARDANDTLFRHYRAITDGFKELKLDARRRRAFLEQELHETADTIRTRRNMASRIYALAGRWSQLLYFLLIGLILFVPLLRDRAGQEGMTGFTLTILFIGAPLSAIVNIAPIIGRGIVALKNIEELRLWSTDEVEVGAGTEPISHAKTPSVLELVDVSFRYPDVAGTRGQPFGPLSLRVEPGELMFLTGGNGSGKTTLALLILGLLSPVSGEIRLGGEPITAQHRDAYRQNFSAVFADAYVFDTLLGYSHSEAQARAEELLVLLRLDDKLRIENGRCSTIDLSRGQRKRLAFLSAYLADRPFYLFDEWAAEQDPDFREFFYRQMLPELKARGKTVIAITHDDRYFHMCDRLVRMAFGQIEQQSPSAVASPV